MTDKKNTLITDEAVEAAAHHPQGQGCPHIRHQVCVDIARRNIAAFIAHHEGGRPCERCAGKGKRFSGAGPRGNRCDYCGGTGKVREDRLVKLSEVVALLRGATHPDGGDLATGRTFADYIERMAKEGKL